MLVQTVFVRTESWTALFGIKKSSSKTLNSTLNLT